MKKILGVLLIVLVLIFFGFVFLNRSRIKTEVAGTDVSVDYTQFQSKFSPSIKLNESCSEIKYHLYKSQHGNRVGYTYELYKFKIKNSEAEKLFNELTSDGTVDIYKQVVPQKFFDRIKKYEDFYLVTKQVTWFKLNDINSKGNLFLSKSFPRKFAIYDKKSMEFLIATQFKESSS